jgi:hypothetical protein
LLQVPGLVLEAQVQILDDEVLVEEDQAGFTKDDDAILKGRT